MHLEVVPVMVAEVDPGIPVVSLFDIPSEIQQHRPIRPFHSFLPSLFFIEVSSLLPAHCLPEVPQILYHLPSPIFASIALGHSLRHTPSQSGNIHCVSLNPTKRIVRAPSLQPIQAPSEVILHFLFRARDLTEDHRLSYCLMKGGIGKKVWHCPGARFSRLRKKLELAGNAHNYRQNNHRGRSWLVHRHGKKSSCSLQA